MEIKDIEKLAELGKIELNTEEKNKLIKDLDGILAYVKQIESVDVLEVEIEDEHKNIWREDKIEKRDFVYDDIIKQFPDSQNNFLKVKKIL